MFETPTKPVRLLPGGEPPSPRAVFAVKVQLILVRLVLSGRRRFSVAQTDSLLMRMRSVASDELHHMMQRRMSQENPIRASEAEFVQRLQRLVVLAVNRLIYHGK